MFINIIENNKFNSIVKKENKFKLSVLDFDIEVKINKQYIEINAPKSITILNNNNSLNSNYLLKDSLNNKSALLCFSENDGGIDIYNKYFFDKDIITIGSSFIDSIFINDNRFIKKKIYINRLTKKIIINDIFVMVNNVENININLKTFNNLPTTNKIINHNELLIKPNWCDYKLFNEWKYDITFPQKIDDPKDLPLFLIIGPNILISISLFISIYLSSYNKENLNLLDIIPSLIFPFIMLLSSFIFVPLQRFFEKRRKQSIFKKIIKKFENECIQAKNSFIQFCDDYENKSNVIASDINSLLNKIDNDDLNLKRNHNSKNALLINLGKKNNVIKGILNIKNDDDYLKVDSYENLLNIINSEKENTYLIDLNLYKKIIIGNTENKYKLIWNIIFQLIIYLDKNDYGFIFYIDYSFISNFPFLVNIPHVYINNQILYTNSLKEFQKFIKEISLFGKCFILFTDKELIDELPNNIISIIQFSNINGLNNCSLYIELEENFGNVIDYIKNENFIFHHNINDYTFTKIANYIYKLPCEMRNVSDLSFLEMHYIKSLDELNIIKNYEINDTSNSIKALLGVDSNGNKIFLDIHEKGDGPHGLVAGCTGSGKSELLITLLLSLAINYSPSQIQFVIIDFKGGGLLDSFKEKNYSLPHINATLTNLNPSMIDRALVSLKNESIKRERLFQKMAIITKTPIKNIDMYQKNWHEDFKLPYLSHLVILVDEVAELKNECPDFLRQLISIARIGRSLGYHLILSTQKPSGIINDQIWSNCRFKICLKVTESNDSYEILHSKDALKLNRPGDFCLLTDQSLIKGHSGYANAKYKGNEIHNIIYDDHLIIQTTNNKNIDKYESSLILNEIRNHSKNYKVDPIWKEKLKTPNRKMNLPTDAIFAIDNYYKNRYEIVCMNFEKYPIQTIFSPNIIEMKNSFLSYLFALINSISDQAEIYLFAEKNIFDEKIIYSSPNLIELIREDEDDKYKNLIRHILYDNHDDIYLYVFNAEIYLNNDLNLRDEWINLIKYQNKYKLHFLLGFSTYNECPVRLEPYISRSLCLKNDSIQEISSVLGCTIKDKIEEEYSGLYKDDHIYNIKIIKTELSDFNINHEKKKIYELPYMKEIININDCNIAGLPIGISYKNYEWVILNAKSKLVVLSMFENEWTLFENTIKKHHFYNLMKDKIQFILEKDFILQNHSNKDILYIGTSFDRQYTIISSIKALKIGQGLLISNNKHEVIKYVNE